LQPGNIPHAEPATLKTEEHRGEEIRKQENNLRQDTRGYTYVFQMVEGKAQEQEST
jgi:hypothetical protein